MSNMSYCRFENTLSDLRDADLYGANLRDASSLSAGLAGREDAK